MLTAEFQTAIRYRLGLPVYTSERRCPKCQGTLDVMGDHALGCGAEGDRIARHDRLRDIIFAAAGSATFSPVKEKLNLIPGERSKPGDVFIPSWRAGKPAALDVTVISPLQQCTLKRAAEISRIGSIPATSLVVIPKE